MIVDCYTHVWDSPENLGRAIDPNPGANGATSLLGAGAPSGGAGVQRHWSACEPVDSSLVLGFQSRYLDACIPNEAIADYVAQHPDKLIGFAGIDPSHPKSAIEEIRQAHDQWSMRGIAVSPAAQDFHPSNSQAMLVYAEAAQLGMPVLFHPGITIGSATKLAYAQPVLLDEIALELPALKIIIAHMGFPWIHQTVALIAKHENVSAEVSGIQQLRWQAYQALQCASECGVMDKLLFGSGFPYAGASQAIEALYGVNHICHGTNLPTIPREQLRGIVERDSLSALGIDKPLPRRSDSD